MRTDSHSPTFGHRAGSARPWRQLVAGLIGFTALAPFVVSIAWGWLTPVPSGPAAEREIVASWFAVGDSGWSSLLHRGQKHVAEAIDVLDREHPADGHLMLGDNFYPRAPR